ncbi:Cadherin-related tumor suppressor, partial [Gryllus bimaculatus]
WPCCGESGALEDVARAFARCCEQVVARELDTGGAGGGQAQGRADALSSAARVTVHIDDVNDNPPVFSSARYTATVMEDATAGFVLCQFSFYVEARDMDGGEGPQALVAKVPLVVTVLDVNDHTPVFERITYNFFLAADRASFLVPAIAKANDKDAEKPNKEVRYRIANPGPFKDVFVIDKITGELKVHNVGALNNTVKEQGKFDIQLTIAAYDLGIPSRQTFTLVNVHPAVSPPRTMFFIMAGPQKDLKETEALLGKVTGARVKVLSVSPYKDGKTAVEASAAVRLASGGGAS